MYPKKNLTKKKEKQKLCIQRLNTHKDGTDVWDDNRIKTSAAYSSVPSKESK